MHNKIKILIAEDDVFNQVLLKQLFTPPRFSVVCVENGKEAVQKATNQKFDLIFLDIEMPVMNGLEAAKNINALLSEREENTPIIAFTSHKNPEIFQKTEAAGICDLIIKPFDKNDFMEKIALYTRRNNENITAQKIKPRLDFSEKEILYDLENLKAFSAGDEKFLKSMLSHFITNAPLTLKNLENYAQAENRKYLRLETHKFLSELGFIAKKKVAETAEQIEKKAYTKADIFEILELIKKLGNYCDIIIQQLQCEYKL